MNHVADLYLELQELVVHLRTDRMTHTAETVLRAVTMIQGLEHANGQLRAFAAGALERITRELQERERVVPTRLLEARKMLEEGLGLTPTVQRDAIVPLSDARIAVLAERVGGRAVGSPATREEERAMAVEIQNVRRRGATVSDALVCAAVLAAIDEKALEYGTNADMAESMAGGQEGSFDRGMIRASKEIRDVLETLLLEYPAYLRDSFGTRCSECSYANGHHWAQCTKMPCDTRTGARARVPVRGAHWTHGNHAMSRLNPPRKRDQEPGFFQIGVFVRTPLGSVIESVTHDASAEEGQRALNLITEMAKQHKPMVVASKKRTHAKRKA